jgi:two-component system, OmpR family, sensor histidine kinase KdpD
MSTPQLAARAGTRQISGPGNPRRGAGAQLFLATAATAAATVACWWLDARMSVASLAMVYLVAVAVVALFADRWAGIYASLVSVTALNYFFVPPRYTFDVSDPEYWWTLAVLLALSLGIGALIARLREGRARAEKREHESLQLHELSEALAACDGPVAAASRAAEWMSQAVNQPCAVFLAGASPGGLRCEPSNPQAAFKPQPAEWAIDNRRPLGRGCPDWPDLPLWCCPFNRRAPMGCVQVLLGPRQIPSAETLEHWQALVRQIGLSVEREKAAAEALEAQDAARSEATRNTLLASLSHDLRTPLSGIVGSASALREQGDAMTAAQRDKLLANLENEARDMSLMADNVLQMARLSQPRWELKTQWESLEEILGATLARMRRRWPDARIQLRVPAGLPPVQAEAGLLAQALANLVDNAVRHGGAGTGVTLQAGRSRDGVFVAVRDDGPGLPPGDPAEFFERYRQGAAGPKADSGAAGLGLAICRNIVEAHGGRIEARRCEPGAEFRIDLPLAEPAGAPDE